MSGRKLRFLFGIHNHQPVGNFGNVLEDAYRMSYLPFIEAMDRHPGIKWSLHASGPLWDFLAAEHPEYLDTVRRMVARGQLEVLGGGYYEPILPAIPDRDKKGQIQAMSEFVKREFGKKPRGMWLAERVWEPHLASALAGAGMEFTLLDDAHFAAAGLDVERLRGYYVTEEQGTALSIFPISQQLRYFMPFRTVEDNIAYFASCAKESGCPAVVMADDGEKFGLWPETHKHVFADGWLERFLSALDQNAGWIETMTFSEHLDSCPPEGRVYLPSASYFEMSEWSLPSDAQESFEGVVKKLGGDAQVKRFLRGGFWRGFLTKYAESNTMHKKMLRVSAKLAAACRKDLPASARTALYEGQCNCAYWHGVFGGLYLPHLRHAVFEKLLEAESACPPAEAGWSLVDHDCDGRDEALYESAGQDIYVSPHAGGTVFEWDVIPARVNMQNVLTRRHEAYHRRLREFIENPHAGHGAASIHDLVKVKEKDLDRHLRYDWYRRVSLVDHFFHPSTDREAFRRCQYGEQGDFVLGEYGARMEGSTLVLAREGGLWDGSRRIAAVAVEKSLYPRNGGWDVRYRIHNRESRGIDFVFCPELSFAFSCFEPGDDAEAQGVRSWARRDPHRKIDLSLSFSRPCDLWTFPLETVSLSEGGFERTYQGAVAAPVFKLNAPANAFAEVTVRLDAARKD